MDELSLGGKLEKDRNIYKLGKINLTMVEIGITRMSSKGQIVIPLEMRKKIPEGEKLIIIQTDDKLILKKATDADMNFQEDLEFAKRTEKAYKRHERGEFIRMDFDKFIEEMKKW